MEPWQVEWLRPLETLENNHNLAITLISTLTIGHHYLKLLD